MPRLTLTRLDGMVDEERVLLPEESREHFDRVAFAQRALDLVPPPKTTVAVCEGVVRLRVEAGRLWGRGEGERWAIVSVPKTASKRAIALAVAQLSGARDALPYALDVLLAEASFSPG
jgi:hypothetical protein